jgi:hypothetical protein
MPAPADPQAPLRDFGRNKDFFVGIGSDGCVFDTMEVKHRECDVVSRFYISA